MSTSAVTLSWFSVSPRAARCFLGSWLMFLILVPTFAYCGDATRGGSARVAVLDFELNDLTLAPDNPEERERTASIKPMLSELLSSASYSIVDIDLATQRASDQGFGYLFDHADLAAELGRTAGADWVVVGRVHKPSFLFVYLKAHVVNARTGELAADLVVEVKGPQTALTRRGVARLAQQIEEAIGRR